MENKIFDDLRPYYNEEINDAMQRIIKDPLFNYVADFLYNGVPIDELKEKFRNFNSVNEFQMQVMHHAINQIVSSSMSSFSYNGFEQLSKNQSYLFVSNHRDILLDSALLELVLVNNGFDTSEITFGSNLMKPDFVVDIGKSNKMFKVERGGSPRDFYSNSKHLSDYIRFTLLKKNQSVWIAQRNGRTKDGNDTTDIGILKMFSMSGCDDILKNIEELNIVPLSISYQYEPCDILKTREIYITQKEKKYIKASNEDLESIITGIIQPKGKVHIEITKPITASALSEFANMSNKEVIVSVAKQIDKQIREAYNLSNTNYMAYDILTNSNKFLGTEYCKEDLEKFIYDMSNKLNKLDGEKDELQRIYLEIYANPVKNKL